MSWAGEEANRAVAASLEQWVSSLPIEDAGGDIGILGDWMAIVTMVAVDEDGDPRAEYYLAMKDGTLLPHVAEGLLAVARQKIHGAALGNLE